jgi:signal peptidase II
VVDFVDAYVRDWHFWAFNVADASITIGAILVFLDLLLVSRHASDSV